MQSKMPLFISLLFLLAGEGSLFFPSLRIIFALTAIAAGVIAFLTWHLRFMPTLLLSGLVVFSGIAFFLFAFPADATVEYLNIISHLFIFGWALVLWLALEERVRATRGIAVGLNRIQAILFIVLFLLFAAVFYAAGAPFFIRGEFLLIIVALCEAIAMYIRLEGHIRASALKVSDRRIMVYSFSAAMLMAEAFFVISFWPFAPLTIAAVLITMDYALANLFIRFFRSNLRLLDILKVASVVTIVVLATLIRGPWFPR